MFIPQGPSDCQKTNFVMGKNLINKREKCENSNASLNLGIRPGSTRFTLEHITNPLAVTRTFDMTYTIFM